MCKGLIAYAQPKDFRTRANSTEETFPGGLRITILQNAPSLANTAFSIPSIYLPLRIVRQTSKLHVAGPLWWTRKRATRILLDRFISPSSPLWVRMCNLFHDTRAFTDYIVEGSLWFTILQVARQYSSYYRSNTLSCPNQTSNQHATRRCLIG